MILYIRDEKFLAKLKKENNFLSKEKRTLEESLKVNKSIVKNNRNNFRVPVPPTECVLEFISFEDKKLESLKMKVFKGTIENISVSGMKFLCRYNLPVKQCIKVHVSFMIKNQPFKLEGEIVRKEEQLQKDIIGYGVKFTELDLHTSKQLHESLNLLIIEKRKKIS